MAKLIVLIAALCVVAVHGSANSFLKDMKEALPQCAAQEKISMERLEAARGKPTEDLKCFYKCVLIQMKLMDDAGVFHPSADTAPELKACVDKITVTDTCDRAFEARKCLHEYMKKS